MAVLAEQGKTHDLILLMLNTPGGTVSDGIAIFNFIRALPQRVVTYNIGNVNSIGNVIFQAAEHRISATMSSFMFHGVGFDINQTVRFERKQLQERMEGIDNDQEIISRIIVQRTGLSANDVDNMFLNMEFLRSEKALERGITDEVRDINLPQGFPIVQLVFQR